MSEPHDADPSGLDKNVEWLIEEIFDESWYLQTFADVAQSGHPPLEHYLLHGRIEGRMPNYLVDIAYLKQAMNEVEHKGLDVVSAYLLSHQNEFDPHPLFDAGWYRAKYLGNEKLEYPYVHYLTSGCRSTMSPHPLFDAVWYAAQCGDDLEISADPLKDYLTAGAAEGRSPHPLFDNAWYKKTYPDLNVQVEPLQHYLVYGEKEGRKPGPSFDAQWYMARYKDVRESGGNALMHFVRFGAAEGRLPREPGSWHHLGDISNAKKPPPSLTFIKDSSDKGLLQDSGLFDEIFYRLKYPDIRNSGSDPASHYLALGFSEGREPSDFFDWRKYLRDNDDVRAGGGNPVVHWLKHGRYEGRKAPVKASDTNRHFAGLYDLCNPFSNERVPTRSETASQNVVSFITPAYNTAGYLLRELYQTLANQTYPHWEWILVDDGSIRPETIATLHDLAKRDPRIHVHFCTENAGISAASNEALANASGSIIALVDHDDLLVRTAAAELNETWRSYPDTDFVYSDECKLDSEYALYDWMFKPAFSPSLLECTMYINHLVAYRADFVRALGGFRSDADGTQDYDLALRASTRATSVKHIPKILYLWRAIPGSSAQDLDTKHYAIDRQRAVLSSHARALQEDATVAVGRSAGWWRTNYRPSATGSLVSYVIPTAGRRKIVRRSELDLLLHCLESLNKTEFFSRSEFVVVHNNDLSDRQLASLETIDNVRLVPYTSKNFNLSEKINLGVSSARGDYIYLLNDDTEAITPGGGDAMLGYMLAHPSVGVMAPLCLFENELVQHNGVLFLTQGPSHYEINGQVHRFANSFLRCRREVAAVTGAAMLVRRDVFLDAGGFDLSLPLNYNDVDFCLRLAKKGLSSVVDPSVEMFHFESSTKAGTFQCERDLMVAKNADFQDGFFNRNFDPSSPYLDPRSLYSADGYDDQALPFDAWLTRHVAKRVSRFKPKGLFKLSIVVPVFNQPSSLLEDMYRSVFMQTYENKEMIIVDDGSTLPDTLRWLTSVETLGFARVIRHDRNKGIAGANRSLLSASGGDFIVPVDADDFLTVDALQVLAYFIESQPSKNVFYSDEFKSDIRSNRFSPFMKPDYDPVLIMNCCYPTHVMALRRSFLHQLRAYEDDEAAWCHDYDTFTRALAAGEEPFHVPELLYGWRITADSTASAEANAKPQTVASQEFVLNRLLSDRNLADRLGVVPLVSQGVSTGMWKVQSSQCVESVARLEADRLYRGDNALRQGLEEALGRKTTWIAILSGHHDPETALLELSAVALLEERIAAVSGLIANDEGDKLLWSGGFVTRSGIRDPYQGLEPGDGGYHGQLRCQRCVDVPAPFELLVKSDFVRQAMASLDNPMDADMFVIALSALILDKGAFAAVTPALVSKRLPEAPLLLPVDRRQRLDGANHGKSRWYSSLLLTDEPYHLDTRPSSS